MCGIVGFAAKDGFRPASLALMNDTLRHRGPDDEGFFLSDLNNPGQMYSGPDTIPELKSLESIKSTGMKPRLGLAHRRLSILDLSPLGHQPMIAPSGNIMVFNGEVYNFVEIREELKAKGHQFTTDSDSEVVLLSYEEWGEDCVQKFVGMWSFCIYNVKDQKLFISRDRFGIKPFYYYQKDDVFVFGSEVKAIIALPEVDRSHNDKVIFQYFSGGKIGDLSETFYKHVQELPAACNMTLDLSSHKTTIKPYYNLEEKSKSARKSGEKYSLEGYESAFTDAVKLHMRADVEVGSCLSGGLDSSALVHFAEKHNNGRPYKTFSAVFPGEEIDESKFIDVMLASSQTLEGYKVIPEASTYWNDLDKLVYHQDFPIKSTSMFAQWEVMKLASENGIKVLLDGQGADEALGGYSYFTGSFLLDMFSKGKIARALKEASKVKGNRGVSPLHQLSRAFSHTLPSTVQNMARSQQRLGSTFLNPDLSFDLDDTLKRHSLSDNFNKHCIDAIESNLHSLLRFEDRNSMAFSVESRVPFLDHRLVEYSLALPTELKMVDAWTKYPLRKLMDKKIPDSIVWRTDKKGFVTPQKSWRSTLDVKMEDYLRSKIKDISILNQKGITDMLKNKNLTGTNLNELWKLVSFVKWFEINKI